MKNHKSCELNVWPVVNMKLVIKNEKQESKKFEPSIRR